MSQNKKDNVVKSFFYLNFYSGTKSVETFSAVELGNVLWNSENEKKKKSFLKTI